MLPYKSLIKIDARLSQPIFLQIANAIIREINLGRISSGQQLPGSREMASLLTINRKTIVNAYEELMIQGWITSIPSKGTFVNKALPTIKYQAIQQDPSVDSIGSSDRCGFFYNKINLTIPLTYNQGNFLEVDEGSPDERLAPINEIYKRARILVSSKRGLKLLTYHDVQGEPFLREVLANYLTTTRGVAGSSGNIMITRGSQMAIYLILSAVISPGDLVAVGDSNYLSANLVIQHCQGKLVEIRVDQSGIDIDHLKAICDKQPIKAIYITPHHHFPTTVTLSAERRIALLHLAQKYKFMILEDDYDYDFHYSSSPMLPLASLDKSGVVIYVGGFSKLLAPSIRVGYIHGPEEFMVELCKIRKLIDRQGDPILERVLADMLVEGEIQRHLKKSVRIYHHRRDLFCSLLKEQLGDMVQFSIPEGGMVVWTLFDRKINLNKLQIALFASKIVINTQRDFVIKHNAIRFGFASLNPDEIRQTIQAIKEVINDCLAD